ncbi:MAG TPA: sigma-54 dependent transcriptional regulator [Polyangia bacterium]
MSRILIVEDDKVARELLDEILRGEGHTVEALPSGDEAIARAGKRDYDLVISDVRLGDSASGFDVLAAFHERAKETPVILITAFGDVTGAMAAIQKGAYDYVSKPFNVGELTLTVSRALERTRLIEENRAARAREGDKPPHIESIVGAAPAMLDVYKMVARVAPTMSTVLVVGESGTGKELVARAIHTHSPRANGPFVAVNCTALTESLLESELFGHAKGAFTGAVASKRGIFEEAQGGTVFLDEIGDVAGKMQAQLLRVLQEGEIRRVGGSEPIKVDVRVVAATNKELEEEVKAGRFREDLYFRINVVTIRLPPLRERPSDIPLLVDHFLAKYAARERRQDAGVAPQAMALLQRYAWPGNVRELENVIERALALSKDGVILPSDLPPEIAQEEAAAGGAAAATGGGLVEDRPTLAELERRYIELILRETGGNKKRAAEILGIDRRTLYRTLERTGQAAEAEEDD